MRYTTTDGPKKPLNAIQDGSLGDKMGIAGVQLIQRLVLSLESPSAEELTSDWLVEAQRRAMELDNGSVQAVPGDEVLRKARALIK